MDVKKLLPKNKHDDSNIDKLYNLTDDEIKPIIYDLLEWLQDYNWPIAQQIEKVLILRENLVFPYISSILNGNDVMWKYWIMLYLIPNFSEEHKQSLKYEILKFINDSKTDEDTEDLREAAIECYEKCYCN